MTHIIVSCILLQQANSYAFGHGLCPRDDSLSLSSRFVWHTATWTPRSAAPPAAANDKVLTTKFAITLPWILLQT